MRPVPLEFIVFALRSAFKKLMLSPEMATFKLVILHLSKQSSILNRTRD